MATRSRRSRLHPLRVARALFALGALLVATIAAAQTAAPPAPAAPSGTWAAELDALARWLEAERRPRTCTERCFTLDRLRLSGKLAQGTLDFELTGGVLADGPVAVPLFGPPGDVRVEGATEDGKDAAIGFEGDHYYLYTAARRFTLRGRLALEGDRVLLVPGPLNVLEADLEGGRVVEGARLSGLSAATIHFAADDGAQKPSGPTVFQLARAVRVGREIGFEYRLVMRSGADLGVVRLPLAFGEKVLDVTGASGFRLEGAELVLPTSGRTAEMTITGTLPSVGAFTPEARSAYEWWLFESDPEHRVMVKGDARQVDSAESPIPRTQASSRLFLVQKGQKVEVSVQPLTSVDVLAAVVRRHDRRVVLTTRGDLVSDDTLAYENNGIDYLLYAPSGRPIYLATDGKSERIMHQGDEASDVLVPLQTGSHSARAQALSQTELARVGGLLEVPMPSYPLTSSRTSLTIGLPPGVVPLALLGGDRPAWALDAGDAVALAIGVVAGALAVRPQGGSRARARALRFTGAAVLAGLWLAWPAGYVLVLLAMGCALAAWLLSRFLKGTALVVVLLFVLGGAGLFGLVAAFAVGSRSASDVRSYDVAPASPAAIPSDAPRGPGGAGDKTGNFLAQNAEGGVLEGVTPVALGLPSYVTSLDASRELVTRDRPFRPVLVYVTDWALWPLEALWVAGVILLAVAHWREAADALRRARERLARSPADAAPPPPVS
jgi:hypothetical protein